MIIENVKSIGYFKSRPSAHKLEGITTRKHGGLVVAAYPKAYPKTAMQKKVGDAAKACGIHTGITRATLVKAMVECIPTKF